MKSTLKTLALAAGLTAALSLPTAVLAANVQLSMSPQSTTVNLGGTSFVDIIVSYDGTDRLLGGSASLTFDSSILRAVNVVLRAPSDVAGTTGTISTSGNVGTISTIGFASFVGINGTFALATIEFLALSPGMSPLTPFDANSNIFNWASESLEPVIVTTIGNASITVVPEPATWALLAGGLGLLLMRRAHVTR